MATSEIKKIYTVLKNLRHDGKGYAPESTVELTDAHAAPLLKSGVVKLGASDKAAKK